MFYFSSGRGYRTARFNGGGGIGCLIFGIIGMVAAFFILKGLFKLLYWASPVLFVLALVINWRAVVDTLKNWLKMMENNPIGGLLTAAIAVLLFPVFMLYLFLKALGYNKLEQMLREYEVPADDFTEFEELESTPKRQEKTEAPKETLVLPEKEPERTKPNKRTSAKGSPSTPESNTPPPQAKSENPYDEFFPD
jgi:hypothetical protein